MAQEKPWKCPKCGRSQSERFERCPVCGVIIAKLLKISSAKDPAASSSSSSSTNTRIFKSGRSEQPKARVSGMIKVAAIGAVALLVIVVGCQICQSLIGHRHNSGNSSSGDFRVSRRLFLRLSPPRRQRGLPGRGTPRKRRS